MPEGTYAQITSPRESCLKGRIRNYLMQLPSLLGPKVEVSLHRSPDIPQTIGTFTLYLQDRTEESMKKLNERERTVINQRYTTHPTTLAELSTRFERNQQTIRLDEYHAMRKRLQILDSIERMKSVERRYSVNQE